LLLEVENLCAGYGDVQVLHGVSLEVDQGEAVSMVGANSAGKTTLLRCLSGLIKKVTGSIRFEGRELVGAAAFDVARWGVAHIPEGRRVFPLMSVHDNLELGGFVQRKTGRMDEALKECYAMFPRLAKLRHQMAGSLSGGEQQMLAIARGLMARPKLLMVDEPSLGLAPILVESAFNILKQVKQTDVTLLLVEQNVVRALEMSDRAYVIENGRIVMKGRGDELLADDHLRKAYMGM
jgi:branched-chain amino acid transport system ATP-binding protein